MLAKMEQQQNNHNQHSSMREIKRLGLNLVDACWSLRLPSSRSLGIDALGVKIFLAQSHTQILLLEAEGKEEEFGRVWGEGWGGVLQAVSICARDRRFMEGGVGG